MEMDNIRQSTMLQFRSVAEQETKTRTDNASRR